MPAFASLSSGRLRRLRAGLVLAGLALAAGASASAADGGAAEVRKVTFKTLAGYPLADGAADASVGASAEAEAGRGSAGGLPAAFEGLDGARVTITGYMLPLVFEGGRTREFMLMRSQAACCFGLTPQANEFVFVKTGAAEGLPLRQDVPASFTGVFRIEPVRQGGALVQCFRLEAAEDARKR